MFNLSLADLYPFIGKYFLPAVRVFSLFMTAPVFNEKNVGKKTKICLAIVVSVIICQNIPDNHVEILSYDGLWAGIQQILIGAAMGLTIELLFSSVRHAGEIIGLQMGLSFASFYDTAAASNMPVIARMLNLLATLLFLSFNGHLWLLNTLSDSFILLPVSTQSFRNDGFFAIISAGGVIFRSGLMLGLPVITLLLSINLTFGILNRLTPQLSIFAVGFPLTLSIGMIALSIIMYTLAPFFENMMKEIFYQLSKTITLMA